MTDGFKNYMTPGGFRRLSEELTRLWKEERPEVVATVAWAASNGDRSENGDYIYGKRRLREIDRRVRHLRKSLDTAVVVDNAGRDDDRVFFGATVTYLRADRDRREVTIVGTDELDSGGERISWRSPLARALLKARTGDIVTLRRPDGTEAIEVVDVRYDPQR
ncbi:MAG: transcription elongation factor GreB [Acidobacteria bacterium]|nr:transcription elongation factor GreB [Acidobacteriota bacterium]